MQAILVLMHAVAAKSFAARAEPPLNPNHPNQRREVPSKVYVLLRGSTVSLDFYT